ncbi:MAG: 3'-5' exonuclease [Pseudomonadales bacterium]|nr:3'-5' exonuclease [Gammaproteobacteria bacterium]MBK6512409.1 3'-5' exonuclease [Haliea sp.]MBK9468987.1 3'-5' exonuclease [Gammaproteobacteria bacterium]MBP6053057.1 3'-5' exonuclease [Pseudomonadales bacterium]
MYKELLWIFTQLPDDYIVLDTETTGLPDENGPPDIVTLGITVVRYRKIGASVEFKIRPQKPISAEAQSIHGITNQQAAEFESFDAQWDQIAEYLKDQLIVIHNASFDWPILQDHVARYGLSMPPIQGVFCSQKAAIAWAQVMDLSCSHRGPSLDALTKALGVEDLRAKRNGIHGAKIDSKLTYRVVEVMKQYGLDSND